MDKQKQIQTEELIGIIQGAVGGCATHWASLIAEEVLKYYQPKIPESAVVLTREEYQRYERIEKIIKLAKREKAIGYEVKNGKLYYFSNLLEGVEYEFKDLQEICDTANHYNEEFFGLDQRLTFWKGKAETIRKETAEKFAERLKEMAYQSTDWSHGEHPMVVEVDYIDEILNEIKEGKL